MIDPWVTIELNIAFNVEKAKHDLAMLVGRYKYAHGYFNMNDVHSQFPHGRYKHEELIEFLGTTISTKVELPPFEEGKYVKKWERDYGQYYTMFKHALEG